MDIIWLIAIFFVIVIIGYILLFNGIIFGAEYQRINGKRLKRLIEFGKLREGLEVYDLGAGYGRIMFEAAKSGANVTGVEIDPIKVYWIKQQIHRKLAFNLVTNINVLTEDIRKVDLSKADVIYCYLSHPLMESIKARVSELKHGARIISAEHRINDWKPTIVDEQLKIYVYTIGESNI